MKSKNIILALSLTVNVVVIALLLHAHRSPHVIPVAASENAGSGPPSTETLSEEDAMPSETTSPQAFTWESVESADYLTYIENLRSIGCPESTIQDIITADVNKLYEQRWKEVKNANGSQRYEYWKSNAMFGGMNSENRQRYKEIDEERRATLRMLLGKDVPRKITDLVAMYNPFDSMLDFLPESKRTAIMELQQQTSERMMELAENGGNIEPEDMQLAQKEQEAALAELLSPEELQEYNLRMSNSANMLRAELGGFEVTEEEFRDLFALREDFDKEYGMFGPTEGQDSQEWYQQRSESEKEMKETYREVLGDERFREYGHEQTLRGSSLRHVAKEFDIPREDIYQVYDATDSAWEAAQLIRTDQSLSDAQRQASLDSIRAETEAELARIIGDDASQSYIERGSRVRNLNSNTSGSTPVETIIDSTQVIRFSQ